MTFSKYTTPKDMDRDIARLKAKERKRGLTAGERRMLEGCYQWLELHYSKERI